MVDEKKAAEAVKLLLEAVGEDPERDGGLQGGTGLGDDVDIEVLIAELC